MLTGEWSCLILSPRLLSLQVSPLSQSHPPMQEGAPRSCAFITCLGCSDISKQVQGLRKPAVRGMPWHVLPWHAEQIPPLLALHLLVIMDLSFIQNDGKMIAGFNENHSTSAALLHFLISPRAPIGISHRRHELIPAYSFQGILKG